MASQASQASKRPREAFGDVEARRWADGSDDLRTSLRAAALGAGLDLGASADFDARYELLAPIGSGAFSVVRGVKSRSGGGPPLCVKTVDVRPLRLRPNFSPRRLLREATILSRVAHANVVRYVGCYEGPDALRVVLERAPGRELFEVILERRSLPEADARPVVAQLTSALAYLHANAVAHRDVKPENVLVDRRGDGWRATLIDFGLSKVIKTTPSGDDDDLPVLESSAGRTFVGTPCYLAPEIEAIHRGGEGAPRHYGVEVDAWSLGAVLHVSLVARFPEFDRSSGRPLVKVDGPAFARVSAGARDLVGRLMDPDPATRLATGDARAHAWLAAAGGASPPPPAPETRDELSRLAAPLGAPTAFEIDSLVELQQTIGACLGGAFESYAHLPEMSQRIRGCAVLCRSQLLENTKLLRKIEQTAAGALDLHEDLELSVASGESPLALQLLTTCKKWVGGLRDAVVAVQRGNRVQVDELHGAMSDVEAIRARGADPAALGGENAAPPAPPPPPPDAARAPSPARADYDMDDGLDDSVVADRAACSYGPNQGKVEDALAARKTAAAALEVARGAAAPAADERARRDSDPAVETLTARLGSTLDVDGGVRKPPRCAFATALAHLERVDAVLERLAVLWSNTEVIFDNLLQKSEHIEQFLEYSAAATSPERRIMDRFHQRLAEYKMFWLKVRDMAHATLHK